MCTYVCIDDRREREKKRSESTKFKFIECLIHLGLVLFQLQYTRVTSQRSKSAICRTFCVWRKLCISYRSFLFISTDHLNIVHGDDCCSCGRSCGGGGGASSCDSPIYPTHERIQLDCVLVNFASLNVNQTRLILHSLRIYCFV